MSKGPGRLQRSIIALIEREPDGAWTYAELCRLIYGGHGFTRAKKNAIGRAIAKGLPGTWTTARRNGDRRFWLCDPCNHESVHETYDGHLTDPTHFKPGGYIYKGVEKAKRYRDATPLERVEMDIADAHMDMGRATHRDFPEGDPAEVAERIEKLKARKAEMLAAPSAAPDFR